MVLNGSSMSIVEDDGKILQLIVEIQTLAELGKDGLQIAAINKSRYGSQWLEYIEDDRKLCN